MKHVSYSFQEMLNAVPPQIQSEVNMEMALSDHIVFLMRKKGLNKVQLAQALGKRPSEVTKWVSGQHNFTIKTIPMLSTFFGEPLISVS